MGPAITRVGPGRARRAIVAVAKAIGVGVVLVPAIVGSAALHLDLPAPRRFIGAQVNKILAGALPGTITLQRVGSLKLDRIAGVDARVFDPEGRLVLDVHGLSARFETMSLLRSLVGGDALIVRVSEATIDAVEVVLEEDATGELGLVRAFVSSEPSTGGPSTSVEVTIDAIQIRHAWAHGQLAALPVLDADLKELRGAFASTSDTTVIDLKSVAIEARGLAGLSPRGEVTGHATIPANDDDAHVTVTYEGLIGAVPVRGEGSLDGKRIEATADVPETAAPAFEALAPGLIQLGAPLRAHATLSGELPTLRPTLVLMVGAGEVTAEGTVTLPDDAQADLLATVDLRTKGLDLSALDRRAPSSKLTARVEATVVSRPGHAITGTYRIVNEVGELLGQLLPAARVRGELREGSLRGTAEIAEIGAPIRARFTLTPPPSTATPERLHVQATTVIADLNGLPRLGPIARGRVALSVDGSLDLDTLQLSARVSADARGLGRGEVTLARAALAATANGPIASPRFTSILRGSGLRAGGYLFPAVVASARGTLDAIDVRSRLDGDEATPSIEARARVSPGDGAVRRASVVISRGDTTTTAEVDAVRVAKGVVEIRGVAVEGLGDPILASARISAAQIALQISAKEVDLARVAALLGRPDLLRGSLSLDVDARSTARGLEGHVRADARALAAGSVEGGRLRVALSGQGDKLTGEIVAALGEAGTLSLRASDLALGGPVVARSSWESATGSVAIAGDLDLARLLAQIPEASRPLFAASGAVSLQGRASRASLADAPTMEIEASTIGLALIGNAEAPRGPDGARALGPPPWRSEGNDLTLGLTLDGSTGRAEIAAKLRDPRGPLASLDASATLPLAALLRAPETLLDRVRAAPLIARIAVPLRSIEALPSALPQLPLRGELALDATLEGTLRAPKIAVSVKGTNLRARTAESCVPSLALDAGAAFEAGEAKVKVMLSRDRKEIFVSDGVVKLNLAELLAGAALRWEASAKAALDGLPLEVAGAFLAQPILGDVSGTIALDGLHREASLDADLAFKGLTLDQTLFPTGKARLTIAGTALTAALRLDQSDGHADLSAGGTIRWGADLGPSLDLGAPFDAVLRAKNFRADAVMPFVRDVVTELDGRVDADARLHVAPGGDDGTIEGAIVIREGVLALPQLGERFHALQGRVTMKPWGTLRLDDFSAEGSTGKVRASAEAVVRGVSLKSGSAKVRIARAESLPLVFEGVPLGRAYGEIDARVQRGPDGKGLELTVDVPSFHLELPQSSGNSVQPLEADATVKIGLHTRGDFLVVPLAPPPPELRAEALAIRITVALGRDVEVKRDTTIAIRAQGKTVIEIGRETKVGGQLRLSRGKLEIQGKQFIVDGGTVSFIGADPADPQVVATAHWDAAGGIRVFADFSGHVSTGKLTLRAEPSLTQDEILALILFGSPDGTFGATPKAGQAASAGLKAAGFAGGIVTQGLNKAIADLTSADITTRLDTSEADNPRPELAVQLSKKVSARLSYKLGVPAPGDNPDRTELTIGWRFVRNWSLEAVVGDQGSTALDVVWRMRY